MGVVRRGVAPRPQRTAAHVSRKVATNNTKKSVSVGSIFKRHAQPTKILTSTPSANPKKSDPTTKDAAPKPTIRPSIEQPDASPLAAQFKEASEDYRRHLYEAATMKINETLETLLTEVYEGNLQTVALGTSHNDTNSSPLKLSIPAKYERMAEKLYQPISQYRLRLTQTNKHGEKEHSWSTLEMRMSDYEDHIVEQKSEIIRLQREWETVVGEIWKVGVRCLGETAMQDLLLETGAQNPLSSPSAHADAGSTIFIPEHGASPPQRKVYGAKKRVTFEPTNSRSKHEGIAAADLPSFLYRPSRYREEAILIAPPFPKDEVQELKDMVETLGEEQIKELRKVNKEYDAYWQKKRKDLAKVLEND